MKKKTVLITGGSGLVGSILSEAFKSNYTIRRLDRAPSEDGETIVADITDRAAMEAACEGVDTVIHLAAQASLYATWEQVLNSNIEGTKVVYDAALQAGVQQVIFASSTHAVAGHDHELAPTIYQGGTPLFDQHVTLRPDSLYGVSKGFGELLGRYYADTTKLRVICVRIGVVMHENQPPRHLPPVLRNSDVSLERLAAIWLSHRDCAQLFECCLKADHIRYGIFYGISNNEPHYYDLTYAREAIGYEPQDGSRVAEVFLDEDHAA